MSVNGVTNVADASSSTSVAEISTGGSASKAQNSSSAALPEDTFTSTTKSGSASAVAQNPSLFQLSQVASPTPESIGAAEAAQAVTTAQAIAAPPITSNAQIAAQSSVGGLSSQTDASTTTSPEGQPQTLNSELLLRGLSNTDIQVIDRFASANKNYDPTTYGNLIQEFQVQAAQQGATASANNQPAAATTKAAGA